MAFATANLLNVYSGPQGYGLYLYKSDTDARATVEASGYFNNTDDNQVLAVDDIIEVIGDEGGYRLYVSSITAGAVDTGSVSGASSAPLAAGSTLTLTKLGHDGRTIALDTLAGSTVTLPAATGTGMKFTFIVSVAATSNDHSILCVGTDEFSGVIYQTDTDTSDTLVAYPAIAADNYDHIQLNGSTQGGLIGDRIELVDVVSGTWALLGHVNGNGTVATPLVST